MKLGRGNLPDSLEICENPPVVTEHGQVPPRSPEGVTGAPLDHRRTGEFGKGEDLETLRVDGGEAPVPGPAVHLHPPGLFGLCSSLPFSLVLQKQNYFIRYIAMTSQLKILTLAAVVVGGRGGGSEWITRKMPECIQTKSWRTLSYYSRFCNRVGNGVWTLSGLCIILRLHIVDSQQLVLVVAPLVQLNSQLRICQ